MIFDCHKPEAVSQSRRRGEWGNRKSKIANRQSQSWEDTSYGSRTRGDVQSEEAGIHGFPVSGDDRGDEKRTGCGDRGGVPPVLRVQDVPGVLHVHPAAGSHVRTGRRVWTRRRGGTLPEAPRDQRDPHRKSDLHVELERSVSSVLRAVLSVSVARDAERNALRVHIQRDQPGDAASGQPGDLQMGVLLWDAVYRRAPGPQHGVSPEAGRSQEARGCAGPRGLRGRG